MQSTPEVTIRPVEPADAEPLAHLHVRVWEDAYGGLVPAQVFAERRATLPARVERWRTIIATSPARTAVADHAGSVVGFVSVGPPREEVARVSRVDDLGTELRMVRRNRPGPGGVAAP